jgi:hypothetical protein
MNVSLLPAFAGRKSGHGVALSAVRTKAQTTSTALSTTAPTTLIQLGLSEGKYLTYEWDVILSDVPPNDPQLPNWIRSFQKRREELGKLSGA